MATAAERARKRDLGPDWREKLRASLRQLAMRVAGTILAGASIALGLGLATHDAVDPSFSTAAGGPPVNWVGGFGAYSSDLLLMLFGPAAVILLPVIAIAGVRLMRGAHGGRIGRALLISLAAMLLVGVALGMLSGSSVSGLPAGWGGALGLGGAKGADSAIALIQNPAVEGPLRLALIAILFIGGLIVAFLALGLREEEKTWLAALFRRDPDRPVRPPRRTVEELGEREPVAPPRSRPAVAVAEPAKGIAPAAKAAPRKGKVSMAGQPSLALGDNYQLPALELLSPPPAPDRKQVDRAGLERNARLLESVLEDFHVRGDIVEVRPGPVVTMYELEPASGIKASRVIQLADDIARNMSALSARVATIPGRSVIGIELPNPKREAVSLSELIGSQAFEDQAMSLPLILGKNISGDPVIADLAPMPHLLVAGTTGSGKSVGLNCMILSLLYRMGPDECRMIMIDPKMLELSVYDDIPHLLSPVVTEPGKAIRAL